MAEIDQTIVEINDRGDHGHLISWESMANGDDGRPLKMIGSARRSVQVTGTWGTGGRLVIEGSNDGSNYHTLRDIFGNNLNFRSPGGLAEIGVLPRLLRPRVTVGDGTTSLDVSLLVRKETR